MNIWLQIGIIVGLFFVGALTISIIQKRFKEVNIGILALSGVGLGIALGLFALTTNSNVVSRYDELMMKVSQHIRNDNLYEADEVLQELSSTNSEDPLIILYKARVKGLMGSMKLADYYYEKLEEDDMMDKLPESLRKGVHKEIDCFDDLMDSTRKKTSYTMLEYVIGAGADPLEYFTQKELDAYIETLGNEQVGQEEFIETTDQLSLEYLEEVLDQIKDHQDNLKKDNEALEKIQDEIELINIVNNTYDGKFVDYEAIEADDIEDFDDVLDTLEDQFVGMQEPDDALIDSLMKAYLLEEDYDEILAIAEVAMTPELAMIISELQIIGHVDSEDVDEKVSTMSEEDYDKILGQLEDVIDIIDDQASTDEDQRFVEYLEQKADILDTQKETVGLSALTDVLMGGTKSNNNDYKSNYYMQLAKIADYFENKEGVEDNIDKAIEAADFCVDSALGESLLSLDEAVSADGDIESIKDIPRHVEQIMAEVMPDNIHIQTPMGHDNLEEGEIESLDFTQKFTNIMSQRSARINIMTVDTTNYPIIEAYVQIASDNESDYIDTDDLRNLTIIDTNRTIDDYTIEKVEINEANIVLCFDTSGSMELAMEDLRNAGYSFINSATEEENVAIVSFSNGISVNSDFSQESSVLNDIISGLHSDGGTNIYGATIHSLEKFEGRNNNILILMTDGLDDAGNSHESIRSSINAISEANGVTVYTVGLGESVDANYLQMIADAGNGKFIYSPEAVNLKSFYDFLHGQIKNQYKITYNVGDVKEQARFTHIASSTLHGEDEQAYYLEGYDTETLTGGVESTILPMTDNSRSNFKLAEVITTTEPYVSGLIKKTIIHSSGVSNKLVLLGGNFNTFTGKDISVTLENGSVIELSEVGIVDQWNITMTTPSDLSLGKYDVVLEVDGKRYVLENELEVVAAGTSNEIKFGAYTIRASKIIPLSNGGYIASGNVAINDMLRFNGDLKIRGDHENDFMMNFKSEESAYVAFDNQCDSYLAQKLSDSVGYVSFGHLPEFELYKDGTTRSIIYEGLIGFDILNLHKPELTIYPDRVAIQVANIDVNLPFQKQLFEYGDINPFNFDVQLGGVITTKNIGFIGKFNGKIDRDNGNYTSVLGMKLLGLEALNIEFDTLKGDYSIGTSIAFKLFNTPPAFDDSLGISGKIAYIGGKLDTVEFGADIGWTIIPTPVPVSLSDFGISLSNLSNISTAAEFYKATVALRTDIKVASMEDVIPGMSNIGIKIPSLFMIDNATASLNIGNPRFEVSGTAKLFENITLADISIIIGNYQYEQALLNINSNVGGVHVSLENAIDFDLGPLSLNADIVGAIDMNNKAFALYGHGYNDLQFNMWWINEEISGDSDVLISLHRNKYDNIQFTIIMRKRDLVNNKVEGFQVALNKKDATFFNPGAFLDLRFY